MGIRKRVCSCLKEVAKAHRIGVIHSKAMMARMRYKMTLAIEIKETERQ